VNIRRPHGSVSSEGIQTRRAGDANLIGIREKIMRDFTELDESEARRGKLSEVIGLKGHI
jgi:hypothetical protein